MKTETITTKLARVEDGHAEVIDTDTNRRIGTVSREDPWKVVSGVRWNAYVGRTNVGHGYTRTEAVAKVVAHVESKRAAAAAFIARNA